VPGEFARILSERDEGALGDILGKLPIHDHAHGGRIYQVNVAPDQLAKRRLRTAFGVFR